MRKMEQHSWRFPNIPGTLKKIVIATLQGKLLMRMRVDEFFPQIAFSFAMLLRYESLEMIPIFLLVLSIMTALKDLSWRQAIKGAGISGICAVLSFFCLIYAMQCEKYISENYSLYFSGKTQMLEKQFSGAE